MTDVMPQDAGHLLWDAIGVGVVRLYDRRSTTLALVKLAFVSQWPQQAQTTEHYGYPDTAY